MLCDNRAGAHAPGQAVTVAAAIVWVVAHVDSLGATLAACLLRDRSCWRKLASMDIP